VSLGYAVTAHSAQGVTADTCHAVLGENADRPMLYVAMTRDRHTDTAHLYERLTADNELSHQPPADTHPTHRGDRNDAANLLRTVLTNDGACAVTAHAYAARQPVAALPERVRSLLDRRTTALRR
jgi:hypothetical protein